jgi:hypothetical protein
MILNKWIDQIGDWNPQLFRELKGRVTAKSLGLMLLISGMIQGLVALSFHSRLPHMEPGTSHYVTNHYCSGKAPAGSDPADYMFNSNQWCLPDVMGRLSINWHLWWTEMFFTLSLMIFFALLLGGTYLLIQDLGKEQKQGTLNFVTLSPQPAIAIALGKILGVPAFLYGVVGFALPLHFWAGFRGGIPLHLLGMFYGVIAACCLFVFSGALLYGLVGQGGAALKAWMATGALFYLSFLSTVFVLNERVHVGNLFDGFVLFNPLHLLTYLIQATAIADKVDWLQYDNLSEISFYRVYLWNSVFSASFAHLLIYGVGIYWFAQAFKRKFHSAQGTIISKKQSYVLTTCLTIFALGFTLQEPLNGQDSDYQNWLVNFMILAIWGLIYLLVLIPVLSPAYQSIQDWSRYQQNTPKEWLLGERSPVFWAIAVNTLIAFVPCTMAGLFVMGNGSRWFFVTGMVLQSLMTMLIVTIGLWALLSRHKRRDVGAGVMIVAISLLPLLILGIAEVNPEFGNAAVWLWTIAPLATVQFASTTTILATVLGQLATIAVFHRLMQGRINRLAASELKQVLESAPGAIN